MCWCISQEREYPGRVSGTDMHNPDFAALAVAYGGHGETVVTTAEFARTSTSNGHTLSAGVSGRGRFSAVCE